MPKKSSIDKNNLYAILEIVGKVHFIQTKDEFKNGMPEQTYEIRIKWSNSTVFLYEKNPLIIKQLQKYKIDDVIFVKGYFFARWFPGAKSSIPTIEKIIEHKKIGTLS